MFIFFFLYFTKADQHNVLVTHYGIRRLQSHTLRVGFPSRDILLGESPAWQSRQSEPWARRGDETKRCEKKTLGCDPHTQSLTFIINYGCFCFILPQPLTTELLAAGDGENGERRGGKAISSKRIIYQNKWDECAAEPSRSGASWERCGQMKIYLGLIGRGWVVRDNWRFGERKRAGIRRKN